MNGLVERHPAQPHTADGGDAGDKVQRLDDDTAVDWLADDDVGRRKHAVVGVEQCRKDGAANLFRIVCGIDRDIDSQRVEGVRDGEPDGDAETRCGQAFELGFQLVAKVALIGDDPDRGDGALLAAIPGPASGCIQNSVVNLL